MEQFIDILLDKGLAFLIFGVVLYFLYKDWKEIKVENNRLNKLILDTLKENNEEQRKAEKLSTQAMNDVTVALNQLIDKL